METAGQCKRRQTALSSAGPDGKHTLPTGGRLEFRHAMAHHLPFHV